MEVAVTVAAPVASDEDPPPRLFLTTVVGLFARDQSPSQAICSVLAMLWFWSHCKAEEKDLLLGSVLLGLLRFLRSKTARLLVDLPSCCSCHSGVKGHKRPVTMSFSVLESFSFLLFCFVLLDGAPAPAAFWAILLGLREPLSGRQCWFCGDCLHSSVN